MNTLRNKNKRSHLAKLVFSAGCVCLALAFSFSLIGGVAHAAPLAVTAPGLGSASRFAVLSVGTSTATPPPVPDATAAVTTTRSTIIGDVGSAGAVSFGDATSPSVIIGDVVLSGAYTQVPATPPAYSGTLTSPLPQAVIADFNSAYDKYAAIDCTGWLDTVYTGKTLTLTPGVYCNTANVTFTNSTLILKGSANAVWIFKIGTNGTGYLTGTNFSVVMDGGGQPCNVSWWVAQYAAFTTSGFQGTILAGSYITVTGVTGGSPFNGDALAKEAVTLTDVALTGCMASGGGSPSQSKCNQGVGNGPENKCDPGNSNQGDPSRSNDELGGTPGDPGRKGGNGK